MQHNGRQVYLRAARGVASCTQIRVVWRLTLLLMLFNQVFTVAAQGAMLSLVV